MGSYKDLEVWKVSMEVVKEGYHITKSFPKDEIYGLTSQCRRAAVSIVANIAEGMGRQYKKDTLQFLHISRGSLYETEALMNVALTVGIINQEDFDRIYIQIEKCIRVLNGFINYNQKAELK